MKRSVISMLCVFCTLCLFGCQADSDYIIGRYAVTITTELSSCGADMFALSRPYHLPAGHVPGHRRHAVWQITRVGITGTGAETIELTILDPDTGTAALTLVGTRTEAWLHSATVLALTSDGCRVRRQLTLNGQFDATGLTGRIRTTLVSGPQAPGCALPSDIVCDVTETFVAVPQPPETGS